MKEVFAVSFCEEYRRWAMCSQASDHKTAVWSVLPECTASRFENNARLLQKDPGTSIETKIFRSVPFRQKKGSNDHAFTALWDRRYNQVDDPCRTERYNLPSPMTKQHFLFACACLMLRTKQSIHLRSTSTHELGPGDVCLSLTSSIEPIWSAMVFFFVYTWTESTYYYSFV
jgi:hypothetical protein